MASVTSGKNTWLRPSQAPVFGTAAISGSLFTLGFATADYQATNTSWTQRMMDEVPQSRRLSTFSAASWRPARLSWLQRCWGGIRGWCPTRTGPMIAGHSSIVSRRLISSSSRSSRGAACGLIMAPRPKSVWADLAVADASGSASQGWRRWRSDGIKTFPIQARCSV
jgi:hypothetical protein